MDSTSYSSFNESTNENAINSDSNSQSLFNCIKENDITKFKNILQKISNFISMNCLENLFLTCLNLYEEGKIFTLRYISILLSYNVNPNINIDKNKKYPNGIQPIKTPLMLACELGDVTLLKRILDNNCEVNFLDHLGRNALFYLNNGCHDNDIISTLINIGININQQDDFERNTALHHLILNDKEKSAIALIDIGNANFMIKNKNDKCALELLTEKWINNRNINNSNDIKKIIKLINERLTIENDNKNITDNNNINIDNSKEDKNKNYNVLDENNLIKLPLKNPKNPNFISKNTYIKLTPVPILLLDTSSNYGLDLKQKIENIKILNRNKYFFLKLLNDYNTKLNQNNQISKNEISEIKNKIETNKQIMMEKWKSIYINQNQKLVELKSEYKEIQSQISKIKEKIQKNFQNFIEIIPQNGNLIKKFTLSLNEDGSAFSREYITKQLQIDLIDFKDYVHNNVDQTKPIFEKLTLLVNKFVNESLGNDYNIKVYGSRATKLCLPLSDIDIVVSCKNFTSYSPLFTLYQYIQKQQNFYMKINYIGATQVPLIKIVTISEYNNLSLDISLEDPKHYGVECVNYIKSMILKYDVLTPMTLAVKNILLKATLNDPYKGGLSSYGVILLILYFLNLEKNKGNDISINNLGNLFYDFLYYYGTTFEPSNGIIDINNTDDMTIYSKYQFQIMNGELVIVDPLNVSNNVGKNTRQFKNIKLAFTIGYITSKENCECGCHYQYDKICFKEDGNEHNILKRIFNSVKRIGVNDLNK